MVCSAQKVKVAVKSAKIGASSHVTTSILKNAAKWLVYASTVTNVLGVATNNIMSSLLCRHMIFVSSTRSGDPSLLMEYSSLNSHQHNYYHVHAPCLRRNWPSFVPQQVAIPSEVYCRLSNIHKEFLASNELIVY